MADNEEKDVNRQPREARVESIALQENLGHPRPLDAPNPPEGYIHRWVRTEVRGYDDQ